MLLGGQVPVYYRKTIPPSSQWSGIVARLDSIRGLVAAIRAYPRDPRPFLEQVRNPAPPPDPRLRAAIQAAMSPANVALNDILRSRLMANVPVVLNGGHALDIGELTKGMFLAQADATAADPPLAAALQAFCDFVERYAAAAQGMGPPADGPTAQATAPAPAAEPAVRRAAPLAPLAVEEGGVRFRGPNGEFGLLHPLDGDPLKAVAELLRAFQAGEPASLKDVVSNPSAAVTKATKRVPELARYIRRPGRAGGGKDGRIRLIDHLQPPQPPR